MAAVRRIDYLVAERDEAVNKSEELKKYVTKLEMKTLKVRGGKTSGEESEQRSTSGATNNSGNRSMFHRIGTPRQNAPPPPPPSQQQQEQRSVQAQMMGRRTKADSISKADVAKLYAAASERSRKQGNRNVQEDESDKTFGGGVSEGRRKVRGARRTNKTKTNRVRRIEPTTATPRAESAQTSLHFPPPRS